MLQTKKIEYYDGDVLLEGYCAYDNSKKEKAPAVLVAHDWSGRNEFADQKAEKLAELGYVGFALDMYGKGKIGKTIEEKMQFMQPLVEDRAKLQRRILAAFEEVKKLEQVNTQKIGAIGFCFGGLCVLDLARSGADAAGVVSFHGLLNAPPKSLIKTIRAKVLALHGNDDPMVKLEQVVEFEREMTEAAVDWQLHTYGNTMHAFTNPQANDAALGTVYNSLADRRSWAEMKMFFSEILC